jgi:hypothetical protein
VNLGDGVNIGDGDLVRLARAGDAAAFRLLVPKDAERSGGYSGWIVVEQDALPRDPAAYQEASAHQQQNRQFLRDRGW